MGYIPGLRIAHEMRTLYVQWNEVSQELGCKIQVSLFMKDVRHWVGVEGMIDMSQRKQSSLHIHKYKHTNPIIRAQMQCLVRIYKQSLSMEKVNHSIYRLNDFPPRTQTPYTIHTMHIYTNLPFSHMYITIGSFSAPYIAILYPSNISLHPLPLRFPGPNQIFNLTLCFHSY